MKTRLSVIVLMVSLLLSIAVVTALAAPVQSNVFRFADASVVDGSIATLNRTPDNVSMTLRTSELDPGGTYTVWWVVFNHPENCVAGMPGLSNCGEGDIFDEDMNQIVNGDCTFGTTGLDVSALYAAGNVVGMNGVSNFGGHLQEGKVHGDVIFGQGLKDTQAAEIHLVVRAHGEIIPGVVNEQISTFMGGCDVNVCVDQQFAVFLP